MIKVQNGIASREPVPEFLRNLSSESLMDLSWTDPSLGVKESAWWPEVQINTPIPAGKKRGKEILVVDSENKIVQVKYEFVPLTEEDKAVSNQFTKTQISNKRWEKEVAGIFINGMEIQTDDRSKTLFNGAALRASIDPKHTRQWKLSDTKWVTLDAQILIQIAVIIDNYVQACFDREQLLSSYVDNGNYSENMLEEGWPTREYRTGETK